MDITQYISTPKNTPSSDPLRTDIKLTKGRLIGGALYFPSGPAGKLHFIALVGIAQVIPFNTGQNIALDDCVIPLSLGFDLNEEPYILTCNTWNESTLYDHALTLVLHLDPDKVETPDLQTIVERFWALRPY